jgi:ArsR family transcriptional regulator, arsenate/arsenite/antimonite-responsive transcriptional repressor
MAAIRELTLAEAPAAQCCAPLTGEELTSEEAWTTATLFKALADPARVRIVNRLATQAEPACVCDFTALLGLSQPTVSFHLKKLLTAGLLDREQRGAWAFYSLNPVAAGRLREVFDVGANRR